MEKQRLGRWRWIFLGALALALAVLIVVAASQTPKLPRTSEAWSRGLIVGQTPVKRVVALRPVPDGGVYLIWRADQRGE